MKKQLIIILITVLIAALVVVSLIMLDTRKTNKEITVELDHTKERADNLEEELTKIVDEINKFNKQVAMKQQAEKIKTEILQEGVGEGIKTGQIASVHYDGYLEDGAKFDSSIDRGTPLEFTLGAGQVIAGWDFGVVGMKVGEKRKLIIPSDLAYGDDGIPGTIPGGAILVFEIELLEIK